MVIPDLHPDIPDNSFNVQLRFEHVSYFQVINNGVLAAQLVSFIPAQLSQVLEADSDLILVLAIQNGSSGLSDGAQAKAAVVSRKTRRAVVTSDSGDEAILVTVAIPKNQYWALDALVKDTDSALYVPGPDSFGQYLDPTFSLSSNPPSSSSGSGNGNGNNNNDDNEDNSNDDDDSSADPLTGQQPSSQITRPNGEGSSTPSNAPIIGSVIGLVTVAYVGIAIVVMRRYRHKKLKEHERAVFQRSISAPVAVHSDTTHGWGW